jgi:uncharacterized damage-inducible protein DinB
MTSEELKYPVGKFTKPAEITQKIFDQYVSDISAFPEKIRKEVQNLSDSQLDTEYRPGGWTIRQVVNHCADSHMNALIRLKLALTEDKPTIKPYLQDSWANLPDSKTISTGAALNIIQGVHERWISLLRTLKKEQLERTFIHPEQGREIRLDENTGLYAWHCKHHLAHITAIKTRMGWS